MLEFGYIFLETKWETTKKQVNFKDQKGYYYFITFGAFRSLVKRNGKPERFGVGNPYTIKNIKLWIKENNKQFVFISGKHTRNSDKNLTFKCKKCKNDWVTSIDLLLYSNTNACPTCAIKEMGERISKSHANKKGSFIDKFPYLEVEYDYNKNDKSPLLYTAQCNKKVWWVCQKCGCSYDARIQDRTMKGSSCPECSSSRGETRILQFLKNKNVEFHQEFKFKDCKYKRQLPFDFYLTKYNLIIEYHGEQHYKVIDFSNSKDKNLDKANEQFELLKIRDKIKSDYCENNNIPLIIIPYTEFKNIESILTKELGL